MADNFRVTDVTNTNWQNRFSPGANNTIGQDVTATSRNWSVGGSYPNLVIDGQTQQPSQQVLDAREFMTAVRSFGETMRNFADDFLARSQNIFDNVLGTSSNEEAVTVTTNGYQNGNGNGRREILNGYVNGGNGYNIGDANGGNGYSNGPVNGYANGNNGNGYTNGDNGEVYTNGYTNGENGNGYTATVNVSQLATNQQNTGATLNSRELNGADTGQNDFTIERGGNTYEYSVNISETSSNRTLQQMMADEINSQTSGVVANVYTNEATEQTTLELTALSSGEDNAFVVADVPGSGNAVAATGIDNITTYAQDAVYTVNEEEYTAPTNTVDVGGGLNVSLQSVTYEPVEISTTWDVDGIANTVQEMVGDFNDMRQYAMDFSAQDNNADALRRRVDDIYFDNEDALQQIGITREPNGNLQVDQEQLQYAIENGTAEDFLSDQAGYTGQMSRLGDLLTSAPEQLAMSLNLVTI